MGRSRSGNAGLRPFVSVVAAAGIAAAAASGMRGPLAPTDWSTAGVLSAIAVLAIWAPLRFHHGRNVQGFNLEGAVLVAMLFTLPQGAPPVLLTAAALVGYATRVRTPLKVAFNVGQTGLWAALATAPFHAIWDGREILSVSGATAALGAVGVIVLVNAVLFAELVTRLEGRRRGEAIRDVARLHGITVVGNSSYGVVLAVMAQQSVWGAALASLLLVGLFLGYRGYSGVVEERHRADHLHEVTRTLVEASASTGAFAAFGAGLRDLLGADHVEIVVLDPTVRIMAVSRDGVAPMEEPSAEIAETLRRGSPSRFGGRDRTPRRAALAAPLIHSGQTVGAIAVFDRHGLEPWDETDLTLLATVANEAAVAVKNIELFAKLERERARLEAESTKLGDIVNAASDGIALIDRDGLILAWNSALADITGVAVEQAIGQPWFVPLRIRDEQDRDVLPGDDSAIGAALGGTHRRDALSFQVLRRDGQWRVLRATFAPVLREDAEPVATVVVARDVTSEREVEGLKADFIATVSHELRTPLTPLKGFLTTLQHRGTQMEEPQLRAVFDAMAGQVSRLENLISDLLVVADLDRGALALRGEPLQLDILVRAAVDEEQRDGRVRFELRADAPYVVGDAAAVIRVVRALVSNALKHTEGAVTVSLATDGGQGLVRVVDEGPGIPPWEQSQVFQRFHRLGDHLTRTQGPGLGLPIARALADRMGGRLELVSDVGTGSEFTLRLPLARPHRLEEADPRRTRMAGA